MFGKNKKPKELTPEELTKVQEAQKALAEKITKATQEINTILQKDGLDIYVDHVIRVVPLQRR